MSAMKNLIGQIAPLRRVFVHKDIEKSLDILSAACNADSRDFRFASGTEHNGWVVPNEWDVQRATIHHNGALVYDGMAHVLGVISNSASFTGTVSKDELVSHLYSVPDHPDEIPYHFRLQYRPWESEWGFCVPHTLKESLGEGEYDVVLETTLVDGEMIMREFVIPGETSESMIFVAHIDHPGQANDDVAGCVVGVEVLNRILETYEKPRYTYRLLITQEIVGSVFYVEELLKKQELDDLKWGMFLEMLGSDGPLKLQRSYAGTTYIDLVAEMVVASFGGEVCDFRQSAGNDEIVFEAPGVEVPMPSLSRWPYDEYHTSLDTVDILDEEKLEEAVEYVLELVRVFETDVRVMRMFDGLVSLANPNYDLYVDPGQIITGGITKNTLSQFQYHMPRLIDGSKSIAEIAAEWGIDYCWLLDYFTNMKQKQLVRFLPGMLRRVDD